MVMCKMAVSGSIAPGARILCRDVEWLVKSIARSVDGGRIIEAVGVSEFIRGKTARFVDELEPDLKVLDPKETSWWEMSLRGLQLDNMTEQTDVLSLVLDEMQYEGAEEAERLVGTTLEDLLSDHIFAQNQPPRWVILMSIDQVVLIDRHKWSASRLLQS
jgi:hypothetical protein